MIDNTVEHFPTLSKMVANMKEGIYQFAMFGMTTPQIVDTKVVVTAIVIGVLSAYTASYVNGEKNAAKLDATIQRLDQSNREQAEFRAEVRMIMRDRTVENASFSDRLSRLEATLVALHPQTNGKR